MRYILNRCLKGGFNSDDFVALCRQSDSRHVVIKVDKKESAPLIEEV